MPLNFTKAVEEISKPRVSPSELMKYLEDQAPEIAALVAGEMGLDKNLTLQDVHAPTALGNEKGKKKPKFKELLSTMTELKPDKVADAPAEKSWEVPFKVMKLDGEQQMVFGWASIVTENGEAIVDKQGDVIAPDDLEKAVYDFVLYSRDHGDMHEKIGTGRMVESMVFTKQKQEALGIDLGIEGWWVGFKVDDNDQWAKIKSGDRPEFSIGGKGTRVPI